MKKFGIISYNMYGNFTNYGSALQSFALLTAINRLSADEYEAIIVDYCPDILKDKNILNPMTNMWDQDEESLERCRRSLPAIKENYNKFQDFFKLNYKLSQKKYTSSNFNQSLSDEKLDGYICGSDTVFAVPEFGFDDGFYANYDVMQNRSVAYAASFGDYEIPDSDLEELGNRLKNFQYIALRESEKIETAKHLTRKEIYKVIDPTLLLNTEDYAKITKEPEIKEPYLLLYSRRNNPEMQTFAEEYANTHGLKIVEISLNAFNENKHIMRYDAGVEEFLGLVKNAAFVITNSFHGMIFAIQFSRPFYIFSRKLCNNKIEELLSALKISGRLLNSNDYKTITDSTEDIDYSAVHCRIDSLREDSLNKLNFMLQSFDINRK